MRGGSANWGKPPGPGKAWAAGEPANSLPSILPSQSFTVNPAATNPPQWFPGSVFSCQLSNGFERDEFVRCITSEREKPLPLKLGHPVRGPYWFLTCQSLTYPRCSVSRAPRLWMYSVERWEQWSTIIFWPISTWKKCWASLIIMGTRKSQG